MEIKKHQEWIDIAKGVAILLVVIGHSFPDAAVRGGGKNRVVTDFPGSHLPFSYTTYVLYIGYVIETYIPACRT